MAERLKDKGLRDELRPFGRRVMRQASLGRISKKAGDDLSRMVNEIEAYVVRMEEKPNSEERHMF
jgi:hypothetical protein